LCPCSGACRFSSQLPSLRNPMSVYLA
jgi:hypothetical protein